MRKRSAYRPKGAMPNAHLIAMMGTCRMSTTDALVRAERVRLAVDDACGGRADVVAWRAIFDAVNMAEEFVRMRSAAGREAVASLQDTIAVIVDRETTEGTKALHRVEKDALRGFAADYAGLLSGVTQREYMLAQRGVEDRIRRVLSGERIPVSVRVLEVRE